MTSNGSTARVDRFERFARDFCGLTVEPFQRTIAAELLGGTRELLVLMPRGQGKTTLLAALALDHALTVPNPEVYIAAAARDQAAIMLRVIKAMIARTPALTRRATVRWNEVRINGGIIRTLAADAPTAHGLMPTLALVDELWAHRTEDLYVALRTAIGKRPEAQLATISSAGYREDTALGQLRRSALNLPDVTRDGALTVARSDGFTMFEWAATDPDDLASVKAANPASFVTRAWLAEQANAPGLHRNDFLRFHAGLWTSGQTAWLPAGAWEACRVPDTTPAGDTWVGVDIGGSRAATAVVWVDADGRVGGWVGEGDTAIPDSKAQVEHLLSSPDLRVREIAYDPWNWRESAADLADRGAPVAEHPQGNQRMAPATQALYDGIVARELNHPGLAWLDRHIAAVQARDTPRGLVLDKRGSRDRIDGAVALAMAWSRMQHGRRATNEPRLLAVI